MTSRAFVLFWGSAVASMLLLGAVASTLGRVLFANRSVADVAVLAIGSVALVISVLVAGRIVFVAGRIQKEARRAAAQDRS